ncbi:MAG: hypothetical protein V4760_13840, partial [Bdellovibrionota bacterium]
HIALSKKSNHEAMESTAALALRTSPDFNFVIGTAQKRLHVLSDYATKYEGRPGLATLGLSVLGGRFSPVAMYVHELAPADRTRKLNELFDVVSREFKSQLELGKEYLEIQKAAIAAERLNQGDGNTVKTAARVQMPMSGAMSLMDVEFQVNKPDVVRLFAFGGFTKWHSLIETAMEGNATTARLATNRVLGLIKSYEAEVEKLTKDISDRNIEFEAVQRAHQRTRAGESFDKVVAEIIEQEKSQSEYRMKLNGLKIMSTLINSLHYGATAQLYGEVHTQVKRAENSLIALNQVKGSVKTDAMKARLDRVSQEMVGYRSNVMTQMASIDPKIGRLAEQFTGQQKPEWSSPARSCVNLFGGL